MDKAGSYLFKPFRIYLSSFTFNAIISTVCNAYCKQETITLSLEASLLYYLVVNTKKMK